MSLTRRAFVAASLAATLPARAAPLTLDPSAASPGPTLRARVGERLALRLVNTRNVPTTLAFPGARLAFAQSSFTAAPGGETAIEIAASEPGFNLYGAFETGFYGALVIDEFGPPPVDLDAIVVFAGPDAAHLKVNGAPAPLKLTAPPAGRVRVRLANASPDLVLTLQVTGATPHIVAIDGAPSEMFEPQANEFPLCPSARFELLLDMPESGAVALVPKGDSALPPLLQIETTAARAPARAAVAPLPASKRLPAEIALERALKTTVTLTGSLEKGFSVNGGGAAPLFKTARGAPVSLTLINRTDATQTMRLEGHVARQLHALDDGWDPYWRDALPIGAGKTLHVAFIADNPGKWPLASASPEKRAKGLSGVFVVG